jgi:ATP-dependent RNA helicase DDX46/PRP5
LAPSLPEDEKARKKAKLEAWKKEREAKKALDEAKAKAMALAGKSAPGESIMSLCILSTS